MPFETKEFLTADATAIKAINRGWPGISEEN